MAAVLITGAGGIFMPVAGAPAATAAARAAGPAQRVCVVGDKRITEASGLAASRRHPGVLYTFNDSGGEPAIYALGPDCAVRATLTLGGARNRDWEAMALGPDGDLYVGDIGDNLNGAWPYVTVYRVREPAVLRSQTLPATAYRLTYADGPRNAETMMVDPRDGRLYIASKELGGSLYAAPRRLSASGVNVLRRVGDAPLYATDGAYAPDGRTFVIRGYFDAVIYSAPGREVTGVPVPDQKQGEGVTFAADGRSLLFGSEGIGQPIWRVPVPPEALPSVARSPAAAASPARKGRGGGSGARSLALLAATGLGTAAVVVFARRRAS